MISDYHKLLRLRRVTQVADGAGSHTETTQEFLIAGYIAELSGSEVEKNRQLGHEASAALFTHERLALTDRVVGYDGAEDVVYEIVWVYRNFHTYYLLRRVT